MLDWLLVGLPLAITSLVFGLAIATDPHDLIMRRITTPDSVAQRGYPVYLAEALLAEASFVPALARSPGPACSPRSWRAPTRSRWRSTRMRGCRISPPLSASARGSRVSASRARATTMRSEPDAIDG